MRIAHLFIVYPHKYQSYNIRLIERQQKSGLACFVFSWSKADGSDVSYLNQSLANKIKFLIRGMLSLPVVVAFRKNSGKSFFRCLLIAGRFSVIEACKPDVIHVHHVHMLTDDLILFLRLIKIPWIISLRGYETTMRPLLSEKDLKFTLKAFQSAHGIQAVCEYLRQLAISLGIGGDKIFTIRRTPEALETISSRPTFKENEFNITTVGRLDWTKGNVFALQAIKLLLDQGLKVHFHIAGDGGLNQVEEMRYWIWLLNLKDQVTLHGYLDAKQLRVLLSKTHIYLQCSITEGIPNSMINVLVNKIPVVATSVGGIPELIKDGEQGLLVEPGDPEAIAKAVQQLLTDPALRDTINGSARQNINFDPAPEMEAYIRFYNHVKSIVTQPV